MSRGAVRMGTVRPVAHRREIDETRMPGRQLLVADAEALGGAGAEIVHEHIRELHEAGNYLPPLR